MGKVYEVNPEDLLSKEQRKVYDEAQDVPTKYRLLRQVEPSLKEILLDYFRGNTANILIVEVQVNGFPLDAMVNRILESTKPELKEQFPHSNISTTSGNSLGTVPGGKDLIYVLTDHRITFVRDTSQFLL